MELQFYNESSNIQIEEIIYFICFKHKNVNIVNFILAVLAMSLEINWIHNLFMILLILYDLLTSCDANIEGNCKYNIR